MTPAPGIVRAHADPPHMPACRLCLRPSSSLHLQDMINIGGRAAGWTARSVRRWATDYRSGKAVGALGRPEACSIDHLINVIVTCQDRAKENRAVTTEELPGLMKHAFDETLRDRGRVPQLEYSSDTYRKYTKIVRRCFRRQTCRADTDARKRKRMRARHHSPHRRTRTHTHTHTHTHTRTRHHSLTQSPVHSPR